MIFGEDVALTADDRTVQAEGGGAAPAPATCRLGLVEVVPGRAALGVAVQVVGSAGRTAAEHRDRHHRRTIAARRPPKGPRERPPSYPGAAATSGGPPAARGHASG
jgi:hypothetical protein